MALQPGQWDLDGTIFGTGTGITVSKWDVGTRSFRINDQPVPMGPAGWWAATR